MNIGIQFSKILNNLKSKNQMEFSQETDMGKEYFAEKFTTTIDGYNYTVASFKEVSPNWKDSGPKGDYLNILTVTDKENKEVAKLSATFGNMPSYIVSPKDSSLINMEKLEENVNALQILPKKEKTVTNNITSIRKTINPSLSNRSGLTIDWK